MNNQIVKMILAMLKGIAPKFDDFVTHLQSALEDGKIDISEAEVMFADVLKLGESYWAKGAPILQDLQELLPVAHKLVVHIQELGDA